MTSKTELTVVHAVNRILPIVGLDDIQQQAKVLLLENPALRYMGLKNRLIDVFRKPAWSNSSCGKIKHISYEKAVEDGYEVRSPTPENGYIDNIAIDAFLEGMPLKLKEAMVLYYLHDLTEAEVGKRLGIQHSAVNKRLQKGLARCHNASKSTAKDRLRVKTHTKGANKL